MSSLSYRGLTVACSPITHTVDDILQLLAVKEDDENCFAAQLALHDANRCLSLASLSTYSVWIFELGVDLRCTHKRRSAACNILIRD